MVAENCRTTPSLEGVVPPRSLIVFAAVSYGVGYKASAVMTLIKMAGCWPVGKVSIGAALTTPMASIPNTRWGMPSAYASLVQLAVQGRRSSP